MLELDTLFASDGVGSVPTLPTKGKQPETPTTQGNEAVLEGGKALEVGHSGHNGNTSDFIEVCPLKPLRHNGFDGLGTLGTVGTVDFHGGDTKTDYRAPGGGAVRNNFALHPSAVILLIEYCKLQRVNRAEQAELLLGLGEMQPNEQVRVWQLACIQKGIQPWKILSIEAPMDGHDCSMCAHLSTRQFEGESGRREYHWACTKGYLILETGRATERVWIAPPECSSWERWYPGSMR